MWLLALLPLSSGAGYFLMGEVRYSSLYRKFPETADALFAKAQRDAEERTAYYCKLAGK